MPGSPVESNIQNGIFSKFKSYLKEKLNPKKHPDFWIGLLALLSFILNVIPVVNLIPFDYVIFPAIACFLLFSIGIKLYDKQWNQPEQKVILALLTTMLLPVTLKILDIFGVIGIGPSIWCSIALLVLAAIIDKQTTLSKTYQKVLSTINKGPAFLLINEEKEPVTLSCKNGITLVTIKKDPDNQYSGSQMNNGRAQKIE